MRTLARRMERASDAARIALQPLNGSLESTVRYLGIQVDDALELSEALEL